jgi:hypothetical protein
MAHAVIRAIYPTVDAAATCADTGSDGLLVVHLIIGTVLPCPARRPAGSGEVVPRLQRVRVVRAQHPLQVGQGPLVQPDRLRGPARLPVSFGEVVPSGQGVRVIRAFIPASSVALGLTTSWVTT